MATTPKRKAARIAVGAAGMATLTLIAANAARRRPALVAVDPELRSPVLHLPIELSSDRHLGAARRLTQVARRFEPGDQFRRVEPAVGDAAATHRPRLVLYDTADRREPSGALLWIHGGGMVMGWPEQADRWCRDLADQLGILVAAVAYRLAPEHPYPAALDDCMVALRWLHDSAAGLGIDPTRVAVGGDSAGGGLSAAVCQRARDEGGPPIAFQLLNYPMLDDRTVLRHDAAETNTARTGLGAFVWTPASNRFGWTAYLDGPPHPDDHRPYAAPARTADLSGLPPAWIGVGELDLFHAEDVDYARRLEQAGVPVTLRDEPGMYHGADQIVAGTPRMRAYRTAMTDALRDALS